MQDFNGLKLVSGLGFIKSSLPRPDWGLCVELKAATFSFPNCV